MAALRLIQPLRFAFAAAVLCIAAVSTAQAQSSAANSTIVTTPLNGAMVRGHVPVVLGGHTIGDSVHAAPSGDFVGTTDAQTLTNKSIDAGQLTGSVAVARLPIGTTTGTVAAGDDSRITGAAQKASNLSDLANVATARDNLNLGNSATQNTRTFDAVKFCGAAGNGIADDQAVLNACPALVHALGGGKIALMGAFAASQTIENTYFDVEFAGYGSNTPHNTGTTDCTGAASVLKWTGVDGGGPQLWYHSPEDVNGQKRSGGGASGICFDSGKTTANTGAAYQLRVSSWNSGYFANNYFYEPQSCGILIDVVTSLFDPRDPQWNVFEGNNGFNYAASNNNANGGLFCLKGDVNNPSGGTGGTGRPANVSFNYFINNHHLGENGTGFDIYNTDHNYFINNSSALRPGGTGVGMVLEGSNGTAGTAHQNYIVGWSGSVIAKGTTSFTSPSAANYLDQIDLGNHSLADIIVEAGASLWCGYGSDGSYGGCTSGTSGATQDSLKISAPTSALIVGPTHVTPNVGDVVGTRVNANAGRNVSFQNQSPSSGASASNYLGNDTDPKQYSVTVNGSGNTGGNGAGSTTVNAKGGLYFQGNGNPAFSVSPTGAVSFVSAPTISGGIASYILAQSGAQAIVPADTTEDTLATVTLPANALGANGCVRIDSLWSWTNGANNKTPKVKFGGTVYTNLTATTTNSGRFQTLICNRAATNSQVGPGTNNGFGGQAQAPTTSAVDTTASVSIVFTGQKASAGDTMALESYSIAVLPHA